jgi:hypothetical protein
MAGGHDMVNSGGRRMEINEYIGVRGASTVDEDVDIEYRWVYTSYSAAFVVKAMVRFVSMVEFVLHKAVGHASFLMFRGVFPAGGVFSRRWFCGTVGIDLRSSYHWYFVGRVVVVVVFERCWSEFCLITAVFWFGRCHSGGCSIV